MKQKQIMSFAILMLLICFGCTKDDDSESVDYSIKVKGIYEGTWDAYGGNHSGSCKVTKVTGTTVNLEMEILGTALPEVPDVKLSDGGKGKINLEYSDASGTLNGSIEGKVITVIIEDGSTTISFSGSKE
jgi:hypothetical protein